MEQIGYKVIGTVKSIKGECHAGHKVGDKIELSAHGCSGLCGFLYHDIFPYITVLQLGGNFPDDWGGDVLTFGCMDKYNELTMELHRE